MNKSHSCRHDFFYSLLWVNFAVVFFGAAFLNRLQNLVGKICRKILPSLRFSFVVSEKGFELTRVSALNSWAEILKTRPVVAMIAWSALAFCRAQGINPSWFILYSRLPELCWKLVTIQDMTGWLFDLFLFSTLFGFSLAKKPRLGWDSSFFPGLLHVNLVHGSEPVIFRGDMFRSSSVATLSQMSQSKTIQEYGLWNQPKKVWAVGQWGFFSKKSNHSVMMRQRKSHDAEKQRPTTARYPGQLRRNLRRRHKNTRKNSIIMMPNTGWTHG